MREFLMFYIKDRFLESVFFFKNYFGDVFVYDKFLVVWMKMYENVEWI